MIQVDNDSPTTRSQKQSAHLTVSRNKSRNHSANSHGNESPEKWFDNVNNDVAAHNKVAINTQDSPYFQQHSSNSPRTSHFQRSPRLSPIHHEPSFDSPATSDDFRAIIDDLTVEKKRLKRKLRNFEREKAQESKAQKDQLFEVKFHGLSDSDRKKLSKTLSHFVASIQNESDVPGLAKPPISGHSTNITGKHTIPDSGYGSLSVSHPASSSNHASHASKRVMPRSKLTTSSSLTSDINPPSSNETAAGNHNASSETVAKTKHQGIQSYLNDIPQGLFPQQSPAMTDDSRKKLVIQRLEEIFCGRGAAEQGHQQSRQQQEVSQSAAKDDRSAREASGEQAATEGLREAIIMTGTAELSAIDCIDPSIQVDDIAPVRTPAQSSQVESLAPEQRPTRPLDLDPHRAQNSAENLNYLRHLGYHLPDIVADQQITDDTGFTPLNLIVNMAQLHIMHVTTEFVKRAIAECSTNLELSADGRKIRWRHRPYERISGAFSTNAAKFPSLVGASDLTKTNLKRNVSSMQGTNADTEQEQAVKRQAQGSLLEPISYAYVPMFARKDAYSIDSTSNSGSNFSSISQKCRSHPTDAKIAANVRHSRDQSTLIFYNSAQFCSDLSRDCTNDPPMSSGENYASHPLGVSRNRRSTVRLFTRPSTFSASSESIDGIVPSSAGPLEDCISEIDINELAFQKHVTFAEPGTAIPFEASGIGGVRAEDNAVIWVREVQCKESCSGSSLKRFHSKVEHLIPDPGAEQKVSWRTLSNQTIPLKPSELPNALYARSDEEESDSGYSFDDDDDAEEEINLQAAPSMLMDGSRSSMPGQIPAIPTDYSSTNATRTESDLAIEDGDDEFDLLATARQLDPAMVRQQERAYDAEMADRLAGNIPVGSSAATAGGGSGFDSPDAGDVENSGEAGSIVATAGGANEYDGMPD